MDFYLSGEPEHLLQMNANVCLQLLELPAKTFAAPLYCPQVAQKKGYCKLALFSKQKQNANNLPNGFTLPKLFLFFSTNLTFDCLCDRRTHMNTHPLTFGTCDVTQAKQYMICK